MALLKHLNTNTQWYYEVVLPVRMCQGQLPSDSVMC